MFFITVQNVQINHRPQAFVGFARLIRIQKRLPLLPSGTGTGPFGFVLYLFRDFTSMNVTTRPAPLRVAYSASRRSCPLIVLSASFTPRRIPTFSPPRNKQLVPGRQDGILQRFVRHSNADDRRILPNPSGRFNTFCAVKGRKLTRLGGINAAGTRSSERSESFVLDDCAAGDNYRRPRSVQWWPLLPERSASCRRYPCCQPGEDEHARQHQPCRPPGR